MDTSAAFDWPLAGATLDGEIKRQYGTLTAFVKVLDTRPGDMPSRRTIERLAKGALREFKHFPPLEVALGLPRDTFDCIGRHDVAHMRLIARDISDDQARSDYLGLIRSVTKRIQPNEPTAKAQ